MRRAWLLGLLLAVSPGLVACGGSSSPDTAEPAASASPAAEHEHSSSPATPAAAAGPLRPWETRQTLRLAEPYRPKAPSGVGTDDYHCFLLDPKLANDTSVTGYDIQPDNADVVHHVILFRVRPDQVAHAEQVDAATPGDGWTCFGNSGLERDAGEVLNDSGWLGAWAPGGGERTYGKGLGTPLEAGSRIVVQIHYNLLAGNDPDQSSVTLREAKPGKKLTALRTVLMPAPVELPCRPENDDSPLCDREKAMVDLQQRFGLASGTANALHYLCGEIRPGNEQVCDRHFPEPMTIRGAAGHMHLLGTAIKIEVNPGTPRAKTVLDIPVWDFDNQGAQPVDPIEITPADTVRVTCQHQQYLRDQQPSFEKQRQDRYILWGEGSTDEMCLGMLLVSD